MKCHPTFVEVCFSCVKRRAEELQHENTILKDWLVEVVENESPEPVTWSDLEEEFESRKRDAPCT